MDPFGLDTRNGLWCLRYNVTKKITTLVICSNVWQANGSSWPLYHISRACMGNAKLHRNLALTADPFFFILLVMNAYIRYLKSGTSVLDNFFTEHASSSP